MRNGTQSLISLVVILSLAGGALSTTVIQTSSGTDGWVAYRITAIQGAEIEVLTTGAGFVSGTFLYDENDSFPFQTLNRMAQGGTALRLNDEELGIGHDQSSVGTAGTSLSSGTFAALEDRLLVAWASGNVQEWSLTVRSAGPVVLSEVARGSGSFYWDGSDPDAQGMVESSTLTQARHADMARSDFTIGGSFLGWIGHPFDSDRLTVNEHIVLHGPGGSRTCPCRGALLDDIPAGEYTVTWNGTSHSSRRYIPVFGIDLVLPERA